MRVPFPERFKTSHVAIFATAVFLVQQLEHTDLIFSLLTAAYIALFAVAYAAGRGLCFPSGAFIFFNGTLTAIVGIVYKLFLSEPGESNLQAANTTMAAYCVGMAGMGLAAYCSHRLIPRRGVLAGMAAGDTMKNAAIGCLALGVLIQVLSTTGDVASGSLASGIRQINQLPSMAILLGTTYEVHYSQGKRSTNWIVYAAGFWILIFGVLSYSKAGMFVSAETWLIAAIAARFNFSRAQVIGAVLVTLFALYYLVPYSQYGRNLRDPDAGMRANAAIALGLLSSLGETRRLFLDTQEKEPYLDLPHFYNEPQGLFDRLQMLAFDDSLIRFTDDGNVFGLEPTYISLISIVPRVFWPDKPNVSFGNVYARELGVLQTDDETTGISFSATGDAYHQAKWFGVGIVLPLVMFLLFFVTDSLTGDVRMSPWGLLPIAIFSHVAPEGLLEGVTYVTFYGSLGLVLTALLAKYVLPIVGRLAFGGDRTQVRPTINFKPARPALPVSQMGRRSGPSPDKP